MAGCDNDAARGLFSRHGQLHGGGSGQAQINDIQSKRAQGACHQAAYHLAADTAIPADHDLLSFSLGEDEASKSSRELYNIRWGQVFAWSASDRTSDAGDALDQCHGHLI